MSDGALIAALLTGIAAVITAWAAIVRAKDKGSKDCEESLAAARGEAETAQAALHRLRIAHPEVLDDDAGVIGPGLLFAVTVVLVAASLVFAVAAGHNRAQIHLVPGPEGPPGSSGPMGPQGPQGSTGNPGNPGKTAVVTVPGTTPVTVAGQGPQGPPGPTGNQGSPGPTGPQGASGVQGVQGIQGLRGEIGATGRPGPTCPPGSSLQQLQVSLKNGFFKTALLCVIVPR